MAQKSGMTELERKARAYADDKADKGNYDYAVGDAVYFSRHSLELAYTAGAGSRDKQLAKAKEIIQKLTEFANSEIEYDPEHPEEQTKSWSELCRQAEDFIKE